MCTVLQTAIAFATLVSAGSASWAGELTGKGEPTPLQGLSWCKYSGLNSGDDPLFDQTQTYGQLVRLTDNLHPGDFNPNTASDIIGEGCNAHKTPAPRGSDEE